MAAAADGRSAAEADATLNDVLAATRSAGEACWDSALAAVRTLLARLAPPGADAETARRGLLHAIDHVIAELDAEISRQVDAILHHPRFQRLEASWRSLRRLALEADSYENTKIRILHITWPELCRDLERAIEFDQSQSFQKIYSEEFGTPGGEPYGLIIGDYEVQHRRSADHPTDDVAALKAMAQVAAAAFAPFVVAAAPALFGVDSFRDFSPAIDFATVFRTPEYVRWRSLQNSEDARFLGIVLPRAVVRLPYRDDGTRVDGFRYREAVEDEDAAAHLWGSAAYAFAAVVMRGFGGSGWFTDLRGALRERLVVDGRVRPHGGIVAHLPLPWFETDRPGLARKLSTDVALSERMEKELSDLGFVPLVKVKDTEFSIFYSNQSLQSAREYDSAAATVNARISTMLQYMFCVSRFAHYVKVIARDRVGSFATPEECENQLQQWLRGYCNANTKPSPETLARYPLRQAQVKVSEPPGRPGVYQCVIHLRPHSQVDQVVSEFRLVTELAQRVA